MRKTKIICTLGPSSESEEKLREIMLAGMNVARFNFSHGSHEEHKKRFDRVMKISGELGLQIATLLDTKGPEIRNRLPVFSLPETARTRNSPVLYQRTLPCMTKRMWSMSAGIMFL